MDESPPAREAADPNALTQPLPIVAQPRARVVPPAPPSPPPVSVVPLTVPPVVATPAAVPYVHRFGNVPWYLFARLAAWFVDVFVVAFVLATFAFQTIEAGFFALAARSETAFLALAASAFGGALAIAFVCEALFGTTLGKLAFALHVRRRNGRHAGALRVLVRSVLRPVDVLLIGPLLALVTPRHQRIGDFLAGTVVGRSRLGFFATVLGVVLLVALGYAQTTLGGGLTSAIGVSAEAADYAPPLFERVLRVLGIAHSLKSGGAVVPSQPRTQPRSEASDVPRPQTSDGALL